MTFLRKRLNSFKYAFEGIATFFKSQTHPKIHLTAAILVTLCGIYFKISETEWMVLIITIIIVIVSEAFNSAIELLCDKVSEEYHPKIKQVKDISAGAVLMAAIASIIIGVIIFLPRIITLIS